MFHKRPAHAVDEADPDDEANVSIDPNLRLRTVRTAHSTIHESVRVEERATRRRTRRFFRRKSAKKREEAASSSSALTTSGAPSTHVPGRRRNIYVNMALSAGEVDQNGEPVVRYVRNKVRTSKYTIITFLPRNLYEQFRRVANLYFLVTTILPIFPIFGSPNGNIAMLPLVFILTVTAIKDAVEDYRRATLDEEVNTSAATKLEHWRNVNQPSDPRSWLERTLGLNAPGRVTKGVRKLRERDAGDAGRLVLPRPPGSFDAASVASTARGAGTDESAHFAGAGGRKLSDIQSADGHTYPPTEPTASSTTLTGALPDSDWGARPSTQTLGGASTASVSTTAGVVDYTKRVPGTARWERTLWKKLEVGDIVLLRDNEQVPADIVVLATSDPDGLCYLETKNLDGETNLKARKSVRATAGMCSEADVERAAFVLDSEPPHQNLYLYHGVLRYTDPATGAARSDSVTISELLLRGCMVRNTDWVIGLVVFTGADTKIMLNGGDTPSKRSKIERETNFNVVMNFIILIVICLITGIASGTYYNKDNTSADFFEQGAEASSSSVLNAIVTFVSGLIAFQNIVPISLYISIEIVKTIQAYFISQDIDMYYQPFDTACVPKTWNISDDLGQIEYVFSDKTGTLTQNVMEFQKCSVGGVAYGEGITEAQRGAAVREGRSDLPDPDAQRAHLAERKELMLQKMARAWKNRYLQPDAVTLVDPRLADDLADRASPQRAALAAFFRALALCHSVLADRPDAARAHHVQYKAESPDEAALVAAARDAGFPFVARGKDALDIEVLGQPERHTPLRVLEFNSTRKRMSVLVRAPDGRVVLYCKGADSVIYERLAADHDPALKERTAKDMEAFANGGLRTLCIAHRVLSEEEWLAWSRTYDAATAATEDRDEAIERACAEVEHSLTILGATALEDKLQEGVPEAIEQLHRAGIKLWILTGDKLQTAIEIGFSCNLLKSDMEIMILSADTADSARMQIEAGLNKIASVLGPPSLDPRMRGFMPNAKASFAVVIDGDTLRYALDGELKALFLALGTQCETVVCCRVSPAQKALTVKLVKEGRNAMTLSIGDGANDVAMIQEANIGCGLFGLEGSQAAMSADYAFGQFRFLTKLLLVHGRWSYQRVADMHSNFFYKNVIWTFAMFWYLPWNSFDATYLYQYTFILLYNLVFTSLPVIVLGAFDQDINAKAALAFPQLYVRGIRGLEYTRTKFWLYMADGLYQSLVVYFIPYFIWTSGLAIQWNGRGIDSLADFGTTVSVGAIFAANFYVGINTNYWTIITWIVVIGSSLVMVIWIIIYSFFESADFVNEVTVLFGGVAFWAAVLLSVVVALTPRVLVKFITTTYMPLDKDIVRESWVKGDLKDRLGIEHRSKRKRADLEATAMYHSPHLRSASEAESAEYHPVMSRSPPSSTVLSPPTIDELLEPSLGRSPPISGDEGEEQYLTVGTSSSSTPNSAALPHSAVPHARSPLSERPSIPSYYSASDLPAPSPMPPVVYSAYESPSTVPLQLGRTPPSSPGRGRNAPAPGAYEMRELGRADVQPSPMPTSATASEFTYETAHEHMPPAGGYDAGVSSGYLTPTQGQRHDRPESGASWVGGRAL